MLIFILQVAQRKYKYRLKKIRLAIREAAPGATERTDYFQLPGYSYEGYDYDGNVRMVQL